MFKPIFTPRDRAERYHRFLPENVRQYLKGRGIPDAVIDRQLLGWNGNRITIPIFGRNGDVVSFRYAKSPDDTTESPKMLSEVGSGLELYGWETLARRPYRVVICEGEFDRLVLEANGFPAVTSTGGAIAFLEEWVPYFDSIRHIFICFDHDEMGQAGAKKTQSMLSRAKIVDLPTDIGEKGDVTDYFVRLQKSPLDFEILLASAAAKDERERGSDPTAPPKVRGTRPESKKLRRRLERLKKAVRLHAVLENYTTLEASGSRVVGRCPFHNDKNPSFTVYPETDTYYCFGCGAHGDVVQFLVDKESMTFAQALDVLERFEQNHELFGTS